MANLTGQGVYQKGATEKNPRKRVKPISDKKAAEEHPLRENAEGQECKFRFTGCRGGTEHTVLAHYRRFGWAGTGQKPKDFLGAFGCDLCHDKQERYHPEATDTELLRAMGETLLQQHKDGLI